MQSKLGSLQHAVAITPVLTSNGDAHSGFRDEHGLIGCFKGGKDQRLAELVSVNRLRQHYQPQIVDHN
jgi:hypothetical protein